MSKLSNFQKDFTASIIEANYEPRLLENIIPSGRLVDKKDPLIVHEKGYYARLTEALGERYPAVWRVLGDEDFFSLCESFIKKTPSQTYNLSFYGGHFVKFLENSLHKNDFPFIVDLARFENHFLDVFHTPLDKNKMHSEQFAQVNAETRFNFSKIVRLIKSPYGIYDVWKLRNSDHIENLPEIHKQQYLFMYKTQDSVYCKELSLSFFLILKSLVQGSSLQEALDKAQKENPINQDELTDFFNFLSQSGTIIEIF